MRKMMLLTALLSCAPLALAGSVDVDAGDIDINPKASERLEQLNETAAAAVKELRRLSPPASALLDRAHGYAVFDSTKAGLLVTGTGGTGVAIDKLTGERIYMRVGGGGLGLGAGAQTFKLVLLFETEDDFEQFVNGDWNGNASAQAVVGESGANATADFEDGVAAFQIGQKGLMAQLDISGLKFWVADGLETDNS